jgi:dTDP-4-amino-4,6-dideoxygalactose transaminase
VKSVAFSGLLDLFLEQKNEIESAVSKVLQSGWYVLGPHCAEFEVSMRERLSPGRSENTVIGCNSGTDALFIALRTMGVSEGDEVLVPAHTAIPTITAICSTGATPVFCDVDPVRWVLSPEEVVKRIGPKVRAVVAVHLYGAMVDVPGIRSRLDSIHRPDVEVIEDVAQAQGALWDGMQAGTLGRMGAFSFYPTKNLGALGDGGAIFCADPADAERAKQLRFYGQASRYDARIPGGVNSRLDEIQAAVLSVRLARMDSWNEKRRSIYMRYRDSLGRVPLRFQEVDSKCTPAWHLCVVRTGSRVERDDLMLFLSNEGVETLIHYPVPTHRQKAFDALGKSYELPISESLAEEILSLPMHPHLSEADQQQVIHAIQKYYDKR